MFWRIGSKPVPISLSWWCITSHKYDIPRILTSHVHDIIWVECPMTGRDVVGPAFFLHSQGFFHNEMLLLDTGIKTNEIYCDVLGSVFFHHRTTTDLCCLLTFLLVKIGSFRTPETCMEEGSPFATALLWTAETNQKHVAFQWLPCFCEVNMDTHNEVDSRIITQKKIPVHTQIGRSRQKMQLQL